MVAECNLASQRRRFSRGMPSIALRAALAVVLVIAAYRSGYADIVLSFTGDTSDERGSGSTLEVLGLQNGLEAGSVNWDGTTDVVLGAATPQSQTITVQQLLDAGVTVDDNGFDVIMVIDETGGIGSTVNLNEFGVFTRAPDGSLIPGVDGFAGITGIGTLEQQFGGAAEEGYIIDVMFSPDQWALFLANPLNRLGMSGFVTDVDNGPEQFFVRQSSLVEVPEPGSLLLCSLVAGVALLGRRRFWVCQNKRVPGPDEC